MSSCTSCNLCDKPGTLSQAVEKGQVPCNVRHFAGELFTVWRCINCGSLHSAEDVDLAPYYAHYPLKNHSLDFPMRLAYGARLRILERQGFHRSERILDYGCGSGVFISFLKEKGFLHIQGFDPFVAGRADCGVLREQYDTVVSYDVIEHVDDPRQFICTLRDLTHPQGLLVIGTPNADHLSVSREGPPDIELSQPYHRHMLSEPILLALARQNGLKPVHIYRRSPIDSLVPGISTRFMWSYINHTGGMIDVVVEPLRRGVILRSPTLLFYALLGYFFPPPGNMVISFRKE
jgi:SAM-dependent methyltransferase